MYYWDGQRWVSTLSPDGRHRWDGRAWVPTGMSIPMPSSHLAATRREPTSWTHPLQYVLASWFTLGALITLSLPFWSSRLVTAIVNQSIQNQERLNPAATPLPNGFADSMTTLVNAILLVSAVFGLLIYVGAFIGTLKRWTWLYYVILVVFGLGLLGLPINIISALTGQTFTGGQLMFPSWYQWVQVGLGVVDAGIFVWMLAALMKFGPWALRKVS